MNNPVLTPQDYERIKHVLYDENSELKHKIPLSEVLESYKIEEHEFLERFEDSKHYVLNAMSNISKAEKSLEKAYEKYEQAKVQLNDDSIDYGKRASDFFSTQSVVNQAIHSLNIQKANAFYVLSGAFKSFTEILDPVSDKLTDFSDKF